MSDSETGAKEMIVIKSSRFGDLEVAKETLIEFPTGLIGFPKANTFIMIDHKPPFSWLQSAEDPNLAFVVIDGFEFGQAFDLKPPLGDKDCDFQPDDEYAILLIVTVRPDPRQTTANLKAPLFVNIRNRKGVQVIFDDSRYSTRHPLWTEDAAAPNAQEESPKEDSGLEGEGK
ncbi:MAG: flagellar assembly protein FliW [SAR324 cluster bacterium]|uniref:Flagellar assembly factor FliW n=1 Tax=SAR324 cluster bacterium TaxID=2024889 RepID=A0A7X9FPG1_9DELT|nr:flagellar assembly protein FliW [SAR324 cluster bacterium]